LFEQTAEPIPLTHTKTEYPVIPEVGHPTGFEVFQVTSVTAAGVGGDREFSPFYHFRHGGDRSSRTAFWYASRRPSVAVEDRGSGGFLHLVDTKLHPAEAMDEAVVVRALCPNRDLPMRLPRIGEEVKFETAFAAPGTKVRCVRNPTGSLRPPPARGRYWH